MDEDTIPAGEVAEGATPLSDLIGPDRHQTLDRHESEREVGGAPLGEGDGLPQAEPAPATPAAQSRQPAPKAAQPPKSGSQPAPAGEAGETAAPREPSPDDPNSPKWYRDHMRKVNRELAELRANAGRQDAPPAARGPQDGARPAAPATRLPNPAEDAEGYHRAVTGHFQSQLAQQRLEFALTRSEDRVRFRHGDEVFEDVKAWLGTQPPELEDFFTHQPDPWGAAFAHMQRETLAQEIGDDPAAWRENERQRMREELLAELQAEQPGAEPQHIPARRPQMRPIPPPPASQARSAQPRDAGGKFAGPTPLSGALKHGSPGR